MVNFYLRCSVIERTFCNTSKAFFSSSWWRDNLCVKYFKIKPTNFRNARKNRSQSINKTKSLAFEPTYLPVCLAVCLCYFFFGSLWLSNLHQKMLMFHLYNIISKGKFLGSFEHRLTSVFQSGTGAKRPRHVYRKPHQEAWKVSMQTLHPNVDRICCPHKESMCLPNEDRFQRKKSS